ncbi:MAG TPA: CPBP family intramembrane glutamic endopeptidase [Mycobacteriales bacterium]|nr:CPBP family intramembrane glutamic endopeptidase [Mycobacteriales bacterium]
MRVRNDGLVGGVAALAGVVLLVTVPVLFVSGTDGGTRAVAAIVAVALAALFCRIFLVGLRLEPTQATVRDILSTYRLDRVDVLGLAIEPVARGRYQRVIVVCADGRTIPASWTIAGASDSEWIGRIRHLAQGFGQTQTNVAAALSDRDRLAAGGLLPLATRDPGLTPQTVSPVADGAPRRWLGWETGFVVAAMALPGIAAAVTILAQHIGGVSDLNEFDLPLRHHPGVSLVLLVFGYLTTALVVPIALLQLARSGQPPAVLGLQRAGLGRDAINALGLLAASWVLTGAVAALLSVDGGKLTNTASDSHVPAYYLIYAVLLSATTAVNEEVVVNGYFLTRLAQLGFARWPAFWISFAVRESYHVYYGVAFLATMPVGYLVTRSFQKHGRLGRAIFTHFAFDVVSLSIAVLTS